MRESRPIRRARGITLLELLITISISVVVLAIGVPAFSELVAKNRITTAMNSFIGDLQFARSEAIKRGEQVQLCMSTDGSTCTGGGGAGNKAWHNGYIVQHNNTALRVIGGRTYPSMTITTASRTTFTFQADGTAPGSNVTWTFCDTGDTATPPERARAVIVSDTGRARISTTTADGSSLSCS